MCVAVIGTARPEELWATNPLPFCKLLGTSLHAAGNAPRLPLYRWGGRGHSLDESAALHNVTDLHPARLLPVKHHKSPLVAM